MTLTFFSQLHNFLSAYLKTFRKIIDRINNSIHTKEGPQVLNSTTDLKSAASFKSYIRI